MSPPHIILNLSGIPLNPLIRPDNLRKENPLLLFINLPQIRTVSPLKFHQTLRPQFQDIIEIPLPQLIDHKLRHNLDDLLIVEIFDIADDLVEEIFAVDWKRFFEEGFAELGLLFLGDEVVVAFYDVQAVDSH